MKNKPKIQVLSETDASILEMIRNNLYERLKNKSCTDLDAVELSREIRQITHQLIVFG